MQDEIKLIIEKNLPAQVGDVLKQRLAVADAAEARVKAQDQEIVNLKTEILSLKNTVTDYKKFDDRNVALNMRETELNIRDNNIRVKELEYQLQAEKDKTKFAQDVSMGLVRNTEYKRTVFDHKSGPEGTDQYGQARYVTHSTNAEEKKTAE